jgi:hypothetical protein
MAQYANINIPSAIGYKTYESGLSYFSLSGKNTSFFRTINAFAGLAPIIK